MLSIIHAILAPLLSLGVLMLGAGFFTTFVSLRLFLDGHDATVIGFVQAAFYAGFLIGAIKVEKLIRRIRHIRAYAFFASLVTVMILFQGVYIHPIAWMCERFIGGVCIASLYVVIESWLLIIAPDGARGKLLAVYMVALYAAQAASQFLVNIIDLKSLMPFLVMGILGSLSVIPVTFTRTQVPDIPETETKSVFKVFKGSPFGCVGAFISGMILSAIYSFLPTYAEQAKISIALTMSITIAGGFLLQGPLGYLSDVFDRRKILLLVSIVTIIPCVGVVLFTNPAPVIYILAFLLGGFCFTLYPLSITHVADRFGSNDITSITAVLLFVYSIGSVCGPLVAPFLIDTIQPDGLFVYIGLMAAILSCVGCYSLTRYRSVPKTEQGDFVPLSGQSPLGPELDPRSDEEES